MSQIIQIHVPEGRDGAKSLFRTTTEGKHLSLLDEAGNTLDAEIAFTDLDARRRNGGPVRIHELVLTVRDGTRTVFRAAELRIYQGYSFSMILQLY